MAFNVKEFVAKHKKLLTYGGLGAVGYLVVWPSIRDGLTQIAGANAQAAGSIGQPAFVPVYLNPPAPATPAAAVLPAGSPIAGWMNAFANGLGGASINGTPLAQPTGTIGYGQTQITGPGGFGYVGVAPVVTPSIPTTDPNYNPLFPLGNGTTPGQMGDYATKPPASDPSWLYTSPLAALSGVVVSHSLYAEWDPVDPSQQWNAGSPVTAAGLTSVWTDDDVAPFAQGPM